MKTVHFHGVFKDMATTDQHDFAVTTPLELVNCLNSQLPGFKAHTREHEIGIVLSNREHTEFRPIGPDDFLQPLGELTEVHVLPSVDGSWEAVAAYAVEAIAAISVTTILVNLAISFVVSAVVKALSPSPDTSDGPDGAAKKPSYIFNGAELVSDQGVMVPLIYGTHLFGGVRVSTDLEIQDIPFVPEQMPLPSGGALGDTFGTPLPTEFYQFGADAP